MKKLLIILLIVNYTLPIVKAQPGNAKRAWHWYFGDGAGLDFSSGQIEIDTLGQLHTDEGCASISDSVGNLLFYTDGSTVWNKNHQIMQNGTGLMGNWSAVQNSIIIPKPKNDSIYYIFTNDAYENSFQDGVRYSTVNINLNGGLGTVIEKNILLTVPAYEQLAAVHHANCEDIWVVCHKSDEEKFYSFLVTKNGVDTLPVITEIGNAIGTPYGAGVIKFSPNGKKMISWNYYDYPATGIVDTVELYDFDNNTGTLSNRITLTPDTVCPGYIFSPDNSKLYISGGGSTPNIKIYQYDLNSSNIENSKQVVYISNHLVYWADAQYSPIDSTIFFSRAYTDTLAIIHNPNASGFSCNFEDNGIILNGRNIQSVFPNFITSYFNTDTTAYNCSQTTTQEVIKNQRFKVYPNPFHKQTTINTKGRKITYYKLYDIKGNIQTKNKVYKLKQTDNSYLFTNKKLKAGIYILCGVFADKGQFNIKLIIN